MCNLSLGVYTVGELVDYKVECGYYKVAREFVEHLAARVSWPKTEVARLDLWENEAPLVLRMENVYSATVETCAAYRAYQKERTEAAGAGASPGDLATSSSPENA